ncbi:MAG TPA: hypothetical protein VLA16_01415 [Ideonella sp.]|nr:hypothetical protein [Ideonella sp.]
MNHRHFAAWLLAAAASLAIQSPAAAARSAADPGPPDFSAEFPAGIACSNFGLRLEVWEGQGRTKELKDRNGKLRSLHIGHGGSFRYTNMLTDKQASSQSHGTLQLTTTYEVDGSQKISFLGSVLLIWFPTDIPAGPSTTFFDRGLLVYTLSPDGVGTMVRSKGESTDICAALS